MIMKELIEVSAQIGGMHSDNPIVNFVYKIIKRKKLKEVLKKIDALPDMPSDEDIINFTYTYSVLAGMDVDGDIRSIGSFVSVIWDLRGFIYIIEPKDSMDNAYAEYRVFVHDNHIEYSGIRTNSLDQHPTKVIPRYIKAYFGDIIKIGLKQICTDMILGGN